MDDAILRAMVTGSFWGAIAVIKQRVSAWRKRKAASVPTGERPHKSGGTVGHEWPSSIYDGGHEP